MRKATVLSPLSFITKLNSNQLNIKKKIDKDNFEKIYYKKNTQKN